MPKFYPKKILTPNKTRTLNQSAGNSLNLRRPKSVSGSKQSSDDYQITLNNFTQINSIRKAVKKNDVSLILGNRREKLRTEPFMGNDSFNETAHETLVEVRKNYDAMKQKRIMKLKQTNKLKERLQSYSNERQLMENKVRKIKDSSKVNQEYTHKLGQDLQQLVLRLDILKNMKQRLKFDISSYKKRIFLNKTLHTQQKSNIMRLNSKNIEIIHQKNNGQNLLYSLSVRVEDEEMERMRHIQNLNHALHHKFAKIDDKATWTEFKNMAAVQTLEARDNQEKQWENLLLSNLFVKNLLKNKIEIQMDKFRVVQNSFGFIKTRTPIEDCETFVERYLHRDQIYGQLLGKVTQCKMRKQELLAEKQQLEQEHRKLDHIKDQILNKQYLLYGGNGAQNELFCKQTNRWNMKVEEIRSQKYQIRQWIVRQILKIKKALNLYTEPKDHKVPHSIAELEALIFTYLNLVDKIFGEESIRMVPIDNEHTQQINMANSLEVSKKLERESQNRKYSDAYTLDDEMINLHAQRQQVLRTNEKFMRDARARFNDTKRILIEKDLKK